MRKKDKRWVKDQIGALQNRMEQFIEQYYKQKKQTDCGGASYSLSPIYCEDCKQNIHLGHKVDDIIYCVQNV
jgi:predicted metalloprotease